MGKPDKKAVKSPRCTEAPFSTANLAGTARDYAVAHHIHTLMEDVFNTANESFMNATSGQTSRNTVSARLLWNQLVTSMMERGCVASSAPLVKTAFSYVLRDWPS